MVLHGAQLTFHVWHNLWFPFLQPIHLSTLQGERVMSSPSCSHTSTISCSSLLAKGPMDQSGFSRKTKPIACVCVCVCVCKPQSLPLKTDWLRPTNIMEDNLLYLKSTNLFIFKFIYF